MVSPDQAGVVGVWIFFFSIIFVLEYIIWVLIRVHLLGSMLNSCGSQSKAGIEAGHTCRDDGLFFCVPRSRLSTPELGWRNWGKRPHSLMHWSAGKLFVRWLFLPGSMFWVSTCLQETYNLLLKIVQGDIFKFFHFEQLWNIQYMLWFFSILKIVVKNICNTKFSILTIFRCVIYSPEYIPNVLLSSLLSKCRTFHHP